MEALPEEMRREVIIEHCRGLSRSTGGTDTLTPEFLNSLPEDIRAEITVNETFGAGNGLGMLGEMDALDFLASLDPNLRQTVLAEQDMTILNSLGPMLRVEAEAARERIERSRRVRSQPIANNTNVVVNEITRSLVVPKTPVKKTVSKTAPQLIE